MLVSPPVLLVSVLLLLLLLLLVTLLLSTSAEFLVESESEVGRLCADGDVECVDEGLMFEAEEEEEEAIAVDEEAEDEG